MAPEQADPPWATDTRAELAGLDGMPLADQPAVFDRVHQRLEQALATTGGGGQASPPQRPGRPGH